MRGAFLSLILLPVFALGQTTQPQPLPAAVFDSARSRLLADMVRQPRYTCVQNVLRQIYHGTFGEKQSCSAIIAASDARKHDLPLASWDRLRLDVGIADNQEIHAWSGAPQFSENEVRRFAGGPFGNGDFATYITEIFGGRATVKFQGKRTGEGRTLFDYTYEVPVQASGYHLQAGSTSIVTGYGGSLSLDPQTADLVELTVRTAELPASTLIGCQARSQIEYGRLDIHGRQVLIPRETRLRCIDRDGTEALNTVSYTSCHEYTSKSVLRFEIAEPGAGTGTPQSATPNPLPGGLPEGLKLNCRIVTPLNSDTAVAGSSVEAVLRAPIRDKHGAILAPSGARIHARLVRFAQYKENSFDYFQVGVHLESIDIDGTQVPLYATLADQQAAPLPPTLAQLQNVTAFGSSVRVSADLQTLQDSAYFPPPLPREVGVFFFVREHLKLNQLDSIWITRGPDRQDQAASPGKTQK